MCPFLLKFMKKIISYLTTSTKHTSTFKGTSINLFFILFFRMKSGVAALDGKLYVVGGCLQTLESCYRTEVFDPLTRSRPLRLFKSEVIKTHFGSGSVGILFKLYLYLVGWAAALRPWSPATALRSLILSAVMTLLSLSLIVIKLRLIIL